MGRLFGAGYDKGPFFAERVWVDTSMFTGNLSALDVDVQQALETIDALDISSISSDEVLLLDQSTPQTVTGGRPVFSQGISGGTGAYLDLDGLSSNGVDFIYQNGGIFRGCEISILGTNDVFFQGVPNTSSGYTFLEAWASAGLILGTGGNSSPIILQVSRTEVARITSSGIDVTGDVTADNLHPTTWNKRQIGFNLIGEASQQSWVRIPFDCTITGWYLTADASGDIVIDLWSDTFANFPPTDADTITGSNEPELSSAQTGSDSTLTSWTTDLNEGDYLLANVDSVSTLEKAILTLTIEGR